ncbi:Epsin-2 [Pteropus alecto]|uniref:Epsin-2 n=1 Tax=Pteropus alecto TaxID=9402 RepID=L5KX14_PTEAL|nr:Epsin-2 [Pteropus alecto]
MIRAVEPHSVEESPRELPRNIFQNHPASFVSINLGSDVFASRAQEDPKLSTMMGIATSPRVSSELEQARPQTSGEEELQLQLALAMSREVAEQEERLRRGDDLRLQMALEESRRDTVKVPKKKETWELEGEATSKSNDGWQLGEQDTVGKTVSWKEDEAQDKAFGAKPAASVDPWGVPSGASTHSISKSSDPWAATQQSAPRAGKAADAWAAASAAKPVSTSGAFDLFSNLNGTVKDDFSEFDNLRTSKRTAEVVASPPSQNNGTTSPDPFESQPLTMAASKPSSARKTPESFLGPNAALVNLDSLVTRPAPPAQSLNPFLAPGMLTFQGFCWLSTLPENGFVGRPLGPDLSLPLGDSFHHVPHLSTMLRGMPSLRAGM